MKKLIIFLVVCTVGFAQSVSVRRNLTANGALLGAVAGAIIGNNSGNHNGAQGALIGAAAGAVLGNAAADARGAPAFHRTHRGSRNQDGNGVIGGAVLGGITGAIIGNNSGRGNGAEGALFGAAAGAVLGASAHDHSSARPYYVNSYSLRYGRNFGPSPGRLHGPARFGGTGYHHVGSRPYGLSYGRSDFGVYPYRSYGSYGSYGYDRSYDRGDSVGAGMLLGGIAGAIIGNNSGHGNGAQGALIGAGIGALLGAIGEPDRRTYQERPRHYSPPRTNYVRQLQAAQPSTVINNYYVTVSPNTGGYRMDAPAY